MLGQWIFKEFCYHSNNTEGWQHSLCFPADHFMPSWWSLLAEFFPGAWQEGVRCKGLAEWQRWGILTVFQAASLCTPRWPPHLLSCLSENTGKCLLALELPLQLPVLTAWLGLPAQRSSAICSDRTTSDSFQGSLGQWDRSPRAPFP